MQAVVLQHLGEVPRFTTFRDPVARDHEILVRVRAAAIRPADLKIARGHHPSMPMELPHLCGRDGTGYVATGRPVYFQTRRSPYGAMAEYAPADWIVPIPDGVDMAMAAALVGPALRAWLPLAMRADLEPGETVLVLGASGVMGRLAVQAARLQGAGRVLVAGHRVDLMGLTGADAVIDLGQAPSMLQYAFASHAVDGIDVVLDYVWGETLELLLSAMVEPHGPSAGSEYRGVRVVSMAERCAGSVVIAPTALRDSRVVLMGAGPANAPGIEDVRLLVEEILAYMRLGDLRMNVDTMPMAAVEAAWRAARDPARRVVLTLD
ncbi:quinone oxidoreductase family protein [Cupriavidus agavae]|uniref:NADPH:quinone reductase-like Zn-dependent oxidoreductase n=1 Tax=Cupriavidus agavae TaxID=1001822 RepID=A0A4Q7S5W4_9BURK|nr:zinc-binding alcohol dehydrogenase family protein [Cupriavidus agavae]RZT41088.1 NADPH:quinone reductase-like Zn-dependent oxidoreductase [Cupriavidus agavae]